MNIKKGRAVAAMIVVLVLVIASLTAVVVLNTGAKGSKDIIITYSNKVDYEPLIVANAQGLFSQHGAKVTALIVSGGIQSAEAIITGAADLGAMGDAPALQLLDKNQGAKIVARYSYGEGMHRWIAYNDVAGPSDLEGKKVGLQLGSSTHGAFLQWLTMHEVDLASITLVPLTPSDMPDAMRTRQVDVVIGSEPWPINVVKKCGDTVHELGNSSGLGNTFPLVLVASQNALANKREAVNNTLEAIEVAVQNINRNRTAMAQLCANKTVLSSAEQLKAMADLTYDLGFGEQDRIGLNQTARFLLTNGKISAIPEMMARVDRNRWTEAGLGHAGGP